MAAVFGSMSSVFMSGLKGVGISNDEPGSGRSRGLFYTYNGGTTWTASDYPEAVSKVSLANTFVSIDGDNAIALVINGSPSRVYYSTNGGQNWLPSTYLGNPLSITGSGPAMSISGTKAIISGNVGVSGVVLFYSTNGGQTWLQPTGTGIQDDVYIYVKVTASGKAIAVGQLVVYYSTNFGATWTASGGSAIPGPYNGAASMNSSGKCVITGDGPGPLYSAVRYSSDGGATFAVAQYNGGNFGTSNGTANTIMINDNDNCIYVCNDALIGELFYSSDAGATWFSSGSATGANSALLFISTTNTPVNDIAYAYNYDDPLTVSLYSTNAGHTWLPSTTPPTGIVYNSGAISFTGQQGVVSTLNSLYYTSDGGNNWAIAQLGPPPPPPPPPPIICFKEGSQILTDKGYVAVEDLRNGDLVKTISSGFKKIEHIGHSKMYNNANDIRSTDKLYKCCKTEYPELTEDLIITGAHSILVSNFKDHEQTEKTQEVLGKIYVTDGHYRLPACVDDRTKIFEDAGVHTIWHFSLEHSNYYMNYGVYANGLLVETASNRMMVECSGMTLL